MNKLLKSNSFNKALLVFKKYFPWFENIIFGLLSFWISRKIKLNFDIRILYIMAMGLIYGAAHSIFSAGLSIVIASYFLYMQNAFGNKINIKVFEMFISFFFVAIISGFSKINTNMEIKVLRDAYNRLENLNHRMEKDLSDAKKAAVVLAEKLKTSEQSYGRLYRIINKLESLESDEFLEKVPEVVQELTGFDKTVLYVVKDGGAVAEIFKPKSLAHVSISSQKMLIFNEEIIKTVIENRRVFINFKMKRGIPDAIIPINNLKSDTTYGIIAISDIPFERVSAYTWQMLNFTGEIISDYLTKSIIKKFE